MADLILPVRYCQIYPDPRLPPREEHFHHAELVWSLPPEQTALILIDCWDMPRIESHLERSVEIVDQRLAPLAQACREAGVAVLHAPSPQTARKYPQWVRYAGDETLFEGKWTAPRWPPADFRTRSGNYAPFAIPHEPRSVMLERQQARRILRPLAPQPEDYVIATGEQLHRLCRHLEILHLVYAGFAANVCVLYRDYGTRAMARRGYNVILLRDGTCAIESAQTLPEERLLEAAILGIEMFVGTSATCEALRDACNAASGKENKT
jgi:nicotinamidase-related amidase